MKRLNNSRGAAVVEYALIFPVIMLLFFGALEVFRLMSLKQSLTTGLAEALPCITGAKDIALRADPAYGCADIAGIIEERMLANPMSRNDVVVTVYYPANPESMAYGEVFQVVATAEVEMGFLYPFEGGPTLTLEERRITFLTADPAYYDLWIETHLPLGPRPLP